MKWWHIDVGVYAHFSNIYHCQLCGLPDKIIRVMYNVETNVGNALLFSRIILSDLEGSLSHSI